MTLAIYAQKCSYYDAEKNPNPVTREELEDDCFGLLDHMEAMTNKPDNHFTEADILAALESFDDRWTTYPRNSISYRSGIEIPVTKRNGRKQKLHLRIARSILEVMNDDNGKPLQGRKEKRNEVLEWRLAHPDGKKIDCYRETGISRPTIDKYWK